MLVIRESQMNALGEARFRDWLTRHLRERFPQQTETLSPPHLAEIIRLAIERARGYGFAEDAFIIRYVELAFTLGPDFDRDPALPWAAEILKDRSIQRAEIRIDLLDDAAIEHLSEAPQRSLTRRNSWEE